MKGEKDTVFVKKLVNWINVVYRHCAQCLTSFKRITEELGVQFSRSMLVYNTRGSGFNS